jgi:hypothetical protein
MWSAIPSTADRSTSQKCQQRKTLDREGICAGIIRIASMLLGETASVCSAHLAFAEDVGGYPASQPNPFEGTIVYG